MTLNSSGLFSRYDVSRTGRTSTSEPGRNARTLSISTVKPPLTRPVITPTTIWESLNAVSRRVQVRARLAFSRERRVSPVPSSTESNATSTSSPGLTSTSPRSFLNCSRGMTASDLRPTLTMTTSSVTSTMSPVRIIPGRIRWLARLCSKSSAKLSVIPSLARHCAVHLLDPHPLRPRQVNKGVRILHSPVQIHWSIPTPSRPESTRAPQCDDAIDDLVNAEAGRIDHFGIGRGLQGCDRAGRVPLVTLGDLARKGGKANIGPLVFQLLIAAQSTLIGAGSKKYLQVGSRKHNGAHIPPVGNQAGTRRKGTLPVQQCTANRRPGSHPRGTLP